MKAIQQKILILEPMSQLRYLRFVGVIQMLLGAENFNRWDARMQNTFQSGNRQPVVNEIVSGQSVTHELVTGCLSIHARIGRTGQPAAFFKLNCGHFANRIDGFQYMPALRKK